MKQKTVTISLRIFQRAAEALHEDAERQNVSVNTLANQILLTYADYDRFMKRLGMVRIASATFKHLIDAASEPAICEAGRLTGNNIPETFMLTKMGKITPENALESLREFATYGGLVDYSETTNQDSKRVVTLTHDLGPKCSLFLQHFLESLFAASGRQVKVLRFDDAITAEI